MYVYPKYTTLKIPAGEENGKIALDGGGDLG